MSNISKVNIINEITKDKFTFEDLSKGDYFLIRNYSFDKVFLKTLEPYGSKEHGQCVNLQDGLTSDIDPLETVIPVSVNIQVKNI